MRVSAKSDYAMRVLVELAADRSQPLTCEAIAQSQDIPYRFLKSVVRDLRQAGLVRSQRGCEGGYWLARDAADITLSDVVAAIDGDLVSVHGASPDDLTYPAPADRVSDVWRSVQAGVARILSDLTIADLLVDRARPAAKPARVKAPAARTGAVKVAHAR
jgi:Rrf2 family protein